MARGNHRRPSDGVPLSSIIGESAALREVREPSASRPRFSTSDHGRDGHRQGSGLSVFRAVNVAALAPHVIEPSCPSTVKGLLARIFRACIRGLSEQKWYLLCFIVLAGAACESRTGADPSRLIAVHDSAGVRITSIASDPLSFDLEREQLSVIDTAIGPPGKFFVEVIGAAIFPAGIVVVDRGLSRLSLFSFEGDLLAESGRSGEGPGEFKRILWAQTFGERGLLVWDHELYRLSRFEVSDRSIRYMDAWPISWPTARGLVYPLGVLSDSTVVLFVPGPSQRTDEGLNAPAYHVRIDYDGPEIAVAGQPVFLRDGVVIRQPFTYAASVSVSSGDLWAGSGNVGSLGRYSSDGSVVEFVRFQSGPPVTDEDRETFISEYLEPYSGSRLAARQAFVKDVPFPDRHAAFQKAMAMESGELLLRMGEPDAPWWLSYSPGGMRKLELPPETYPLALSGTQAVLRYTDSSDVHWVFLARRTPR